jgi:hypothetical protein
MHDFYVGLTTAPRNAAERVSDEALYRSAKSAERVRDKALYRSANSAERVRDKALTYHPEVRRSTSARTRIKGV